MALPSTDELHRLFRYDEETGVLYWRVNRPPRGRAGMPAGYVNERGYVIVRVGKLHRVSRIIWTMMCGAIEDDAVVDHINMNPSDNRLANLRIATKSQNAANVVAHRDSKTGFKGVTLSEGRYVASIGLQGKRVHLGCFGTPEEAHAAYMSAARRHFGEFARSA